MQDREYFLTIGGELERAANNGTVLNPATEQMIAKFPMASRQQLDKAVAAAKSAFGAWSCTPLAERQHRVKALGDVLNENKDELVELLVTEQGKSRDGAEWEIGGAIHWCFEIAKQSLEDEVIEDDSGNVVVSRYTPIGVVGAITPWNFPVLLAVWKIAPALLAGNTLVLKPSPFTPLCTLWLGELASRVLPNGVLNVISGDNDLGQWITEHPDIGKISFTGSTATGKRVMQSASVNLKRLTLELGGNDAAIVLPDVNPKEIAKDLFWACFANSAQFCVACKRLYVHEDVYEDISQELVAYAKTVKLGNGLEPSTQLGPLQNKIQFEKVKDLIEATRQAGHQFLLGGDIPSGDGYFIPVTIVNNPPEDARCVVEEAFGPVLPILKYRDIEDVIARANNTEFGLAGSVWSRDIEKAERIAQRLQTGTVWINHAHQFSPNYAFGGHKRSGMGIENSLHGLAEYANIQTVIRKSRD